MVTKAVPKDELVAKLHDFILQYNADIGLKAGMPEDQVKIIMNEQAKANRLLCEHIYDFLHLEGYIDRA